jgi:choline dehydrogenase
MMMSKSDPALSEPDVLIYWVPGYLRGFFHGLSDEFAKIHNVLTAIVLLAHPSSRGVVRLTGNHPQDPVRIEKNHFEAAGGRQDIISLREATKVVRNIVEHLNITMHVDAQVFPDPEVQSDEEIEDHILEHVFGILCGSPRVTPFSTLSLQGITVAAPTQSVRMTVCFFIFCSTVSGEF